MGVYGVWDQTDVWHVCLQIVFHACCSCCTKKKWGYNWVYSPNMFAQSLLFLGKLSGSRVWLSPLGTQIQQLAGYGSSYIDHLHILSLDDFIISRPWPSTWGRPGFPTPVATPPPMARMCNLDVAGVYQKKGFGFLLPWGVGWPPVQFQTPI